MSITGQSVYFRILEGVRDLIQGILGDLPDVRNVEVRLAGKFFDAPFDLLPIVDIIHGDPDRTEMLNFEGYRTKTFDVLVAFLAANNQDYASKLDTYMLWRERVESALDPADGPVLASVPDNVTGVEILGQEVVDSHLAGRGYAYTAVGVRYTVVVTRPQGAA